jgi:YggT family protein
MVLVAARSSPSCAALWRPRPAAGIDLSPILAFVVLDLFQSSAAALPAEIDENGQLKQPARAGNAWQRRMQATAERRRLQREQQQQQQE